MRATKVAGNLESLCRNHKPCRTWVLKPLRQSRRKEEDVGDCHLQAVPATRLQSHVLIIERNNSLEYF